MDHCALLIGAASRRTSPRLSIRRGLTDTGRSRCEIAPARPIGGPRLGRKRR